MLEIKWIHCPTMNHLSRMELQLKFSFDLVLIAPPSRRLKHFSLFSASKTHILSWKCQTSPEPSSDHQSSGERRRKSTIPVNDHPYTQISKNPVRKSVELIQKQRKKARNCTRQWHRVDSAVNASPIQGQNGVFLYLG